MTGSDAVGLTMGYYDTTAAADLQVPARAPATRTTRSPTTSSRRAFGGSFLNHQWLIAARDAGRPDARTTAAPTTCTRSLDANGMPTQLPAATRRPATPSPTGSRSTAGLRPARRAAAGARLRRLRRQHDAAGRTSRPAPASAPTARRRRRTPTIGDRLSADGRRLGLVLGRLVERRRRRRRARAGRTAPAPDRARDPNVADRAPALPELPGQAVPVPPPAVQLLRRTTRRARPARARTCGRGRVHRAAAARSDVHAASRSASSSRSAPRTSTPATRASRNGSDHLVDLLQGDREQPAAPRTRWSS